MSGQQKLSKKFPTSPSFLSVNAEIVGRQLVVRLGPRVYIFWIRKTNLVAFWKSCQKLLIDLFHLQTDFSRCCNQSHGYSQNSEISKCFLCYMRWSKKILITWCWCAVKLQSILNLCYQSIPYILYSDSLLWKYQWFWLGISCSMMLKAIWWICQARQMCQSSSTYSFYQSNRQIFG